jgi:hypothetical protein
MFLQGTPLQKKSTMEFVGGFLKKKVVEHL